MQDKSKNKMVSGDARNDFVVTKYKQGFSPTEIGILLKKEGFRPITRIRIHQILKEKKAQ